MAISVAVPKDLSGIKTKVAFNLTKRQIICFSGAAAGIPFYFFAKDVLGTEAAAVIMVAVMLPFFFLAMYERNGFPAEKILYFIIRQKFLTPGIRPYRSESLYRTLEEREKLRKELCRLERKEKREKGRQAHRFGKKTHKGAAPYPCGRGKAQESAGNRTGDDYFPQALSKRHL